MALTRYEPGPGPSVRAGHAAGGAHTDSGRHSAPAILVALPSSGGLERRIEPSPRLRANPQPCAPGVRDGHAAGCGITVETAPSGRRGG